MKRRAWLTKFPADKITRIDKSMQALDHRATEMFEGDDGEIHIALRPGCWLEGPVLTNLLEQARSFCIDGTDMRVSYEASAADLDDRTQSLGRQTKRSLLRGSREPYDSAIPEDKHDALDAITRFLFVTFDGDGCRMYQPSADKCLVSLAASRVLSSELVELARAPHVVGWRVVAGEDDSEARVEVFV